MKVVMLTSDAPNQNALAAKVAQQFDLIAVVIEKRKPLHVKRNFKMYFNAMLDRTLLKEIREAWFSMIDFYRKNYVFPKVQTITVENINNDEVRDFLKKMNPDVVMVSGTAMIRKKILELKFAYGIVNLHTGLSPYVKGGPNCTNWCLATGQFHLIGNTVMWIDAGIDSGDLILTETTPLTGEESLQELHIKVMEHAHALYIKALHKVEAGSGKIHSVKQSSIAEGKTFFTKEWNAWQKWKAQKNFRRFQSTVQSDLFKEKRALLKVVG
jgi:methionyl-tRNA formyltransferase